MRCESTLDRLTADHQLSFTEWGTVDELFEEYLKGAAKELLIITISGKSQHYDESSCDKILTRMDEFTMSLPEKIRCDINDALRKQV